MSEFYTNEILSDQKLKKDILVKQFKNLDKRKFNEELANIDWNQLLALYCNDPNISLDIFLKSVKSIFDRHVSLIRVTKRMEKPYKYPKPTRDILVSFKKKNKIFHRFCRAKDPERKKSLHETLKKYRNIANLTRISKEKHCKNYFQENKNNLCKT